MTNNINSQKQNTVTEFFSKNPAGYFGTYASISPDGHSFQTREARLIELLGNGTGKLLDIGCGPGVTSPAIINLGWQYEGIDISEKMIEEARQRIPDAIFHTGSVEHIQAPDNTYEAVVAMGLVEYVEDDKKAIKEIFRVLKPGGRVFISLPNQLSPLRMWDRYLIAPIGALAKKIFGRKRRGVFHREYIPSQYKKLLKKEGLIPKRMLAHNIRLLPRPFDGWFPKISVIISRNFEWLAKTLIWFIGTSVIVEAEKPNL